MHPTSKGIYTAQQVHWNKQSSNQSLPKGSFLQNDKKNKENCYFFGQYTEQIMSVCEQLDPFFSLSSPYLGFRVFFFFLYLIIKAQVLALIPQVYVNIVRTV